MFDASEIESSGFVCISAETRLALLNRQIAYAAARSPFYRETLRGISPPERLSDLSRLPFTDAKALQTEGRRMVCVSGAEIARIVSLATSGSTGNRKRLYFTDGDLRRTVDFFAEGMAWMCAPGDLCGVLMPCTAPNGIGDLLCRGLEAIGVTPLPLGTETSMEVLRRRLEETQPAVLVGFPWTLRLLALTCPALRPRAVLLSGDYVPDGAAKLIAECWGCRVLRHFGMTETGYGGAVEHPAKRELFLRRDELIAEVIDPVSGEALSAGSAGELVLTTLRREAMPLLRYRTGDLAVLTEEGNIAEVQGRKDGLRRDYQLQDALSPIPWLWDYRTEPGRLIADISDSAPRDAEAELKLSSGMETTVRRLPRENAAPFFAGKRRQESAL